MKKYITNSPAQTKNLAKRLAGQFKSGPASSLPASSARRASQGGVVLGLVGELGSGKTQFVKGLAEYFGIKQVITSPTFVLMKPYSIPRDLSTPPTKTSGSVEINYKKLIHVDCYRLDRPEELLAIGLQEYINNSPCGEAGKNNLVAIEWAEKVRDILPKHTIWIRFELGKNEKQRVIKTYC